MPNISQAILAMVHPATVCNDRTRGEELWSRSRATFGLPRLVKFCWRFVLSVDQATARGSRTRCTRRKSSPNLLDKRKGMKVEPHAVFDESTMTAYWREM